MGFPNRVTEKHCVHIERTKMHQWEFTQGDLLSSAFEEQHFLFKTNITNSHQFDYLSIQKLWRGEVIMECGELTRKIGEGKVLRWMEKLVKWKEVKP